MEQRSQSAKPRSILSVPYTDVHHALRRYLELAQDFIVASLAIVLLVVMLQELWTLAQLAFVLGRASSEILSQIVLLFVQASRASWSRPSSRRLYPRNRKLDFSPA